MWQRTTLEKIVALTIIADACKFLSTEMLATVKPELIADIQDGMKSGINAMQDGIDEIDDALEMVGPMAAGSKLEKQRDEMATTVKHMKVANKAVPAIFDEAEQNYLAEINATTPAIQGAYREMLNEGFKGMALFCGRLSCLGPGRAGALPRQTQKAIAGKKHTHHLLEYSTLANKRS